MNNNLPNLLWIVVFIVASNYKCFAQDEPDENAVTPLKITLAGLFHEEYSQERFVFHSVIYTYNLMQSLIHVKGEASIISATDNFKSGHYMCKLVEEDEFGIGAVFGPNSVKTAPLIESICLNLEIPHMQISWRPSASGNHYAESCGLINLFPKIELLVKGIGVIVKHLQWKSFVILYENADSLIRLQDVLKIQNFNSNNKFNIIAVKHLGAGPDYRPVLKEIKNTTEPRVVLDCKTENIVEVLRQAAELDLLKDRYSYFLTSLDAHTVDLASLNITANITTIRIINPEEQDFKRAQENWKHYVMLRDIDLDMEQYSIKTETALMHDALNLYLTTLSALHVGQQPIQASQLNCAENEKKWEDGYRIISFMQKQERIKFGSTGTVKFDSCGRRTNFTIYVVEGNRDDISAVWTPDNPESLQYFKTQEDRNEAAMQRLTKGVLVVSSRIGAPYLMERKAAEGEVLEGNDRYEGFSMDLIAALIEQMKMFNLTFKFQFELAKDKKYGNYDEKTKSWNGLIKDILDGNAQLAICDLTITHERREVVDFSTPFMRLGISILHKKDEEKPVNIFAVYQAFSVDLWIYTATLYLAITVAIYFISRMSPADWESPHPCDENPEELENIWNMKNCLWLTLGSLMNQGCDLLPKGFSSRMISATWWFFVIIVSNSYMANLTAFLTTGRMEGSINSVKDLASQTKIKYGTLAGGSTEAFFKTTKNILYQRMWANMQQAKPTVFENHNNDGVNRVKNTRHGLYAFLIESTTLEYQLETQCDLRQVGSWLDSKGYGIAMPIDYPLRSKINEALLKLQDKGTIRRLKDKWWKEQRTDPICPKEVEDEDEKLGRLKLENVGGVFIVLGVGVGASYLVAIFEFFWNVRNVSVEEHITYWEALKVEVVFALNIWVTKKKTKPKISKSSSDSGSDSKSIAHSILQGAGSFLRLNVLNKSESPMRVDD